VEKAVQRAAKLYSLTEHLEEAATDVTRSLEALKAAGLARLPGADLQLEYPVTATWSDGQLASGYIDLVAVEHDRVNVIAFKTDTPPPGLLEQTYPKYAAQVRVYGKLLEATGVLKGSLRSLIYGNWCDPLGPVMTLYARIPEASFSDGKIPVERDSDPN
jgi:hypothetical protein